MAERTEPMDQALDESARRVIAAWRLERRERARAIASPPTLDAIVAGEADTKGLGLEALARQAEELLTADELDAWQRGE